MENLGDIIRKYRKKAPLTTQELADKIKATGQPIDRSYISKIERYNYVPSFKIYAEIEKALNIPHSYRKLFTDTGLKPFNEWEKRSKQLDKIQKDLEKISNYLDKIKYVDTIPFRQELGKKWNELIAKGKKISKAFEKDQKKLLGIKKP
jgi:transcriptional regulator with XRE-family HTH domain